MKIPLSFLLLVLFLAGCRAASDPFDAPAASLEVSKSLTDLPVLRKAPELTNKVWLNTEKPLRLADLQGQVVLLDMWTFG